MRSLLRACLCAAACSVVALCFAQDKLPRKPWFGAVLAPQEGGILISALLPGGSAGPSGIKVGDLLLSLDGKPTTAPMNIGQVVNAHKVGDKLTAKVRRDGKEIEIPLTIVGKPLDKGDNYTVDYEDVTSFGARIRVLISKPTNVTGKRPVLFFVQGIGYSTLDWPLTNPNAHAQIFKAFNDKGFVTVRVEKPGVGDSEGGPANTVDFERELDAFRQALKLVKGKDYVDTDKIFIFGHSMGGCDAPILASESPVKGVFVYGTVARPWQEYTLENTRRQALMAGANPAQLDTEMRDMMAVMHLVFNEGMDIEEAKTKYPKYAQALSEFSQDGKTMSGMPIPYWRQIYAKNLAEYWQKVDCNVMAVWGESDFLASQWDHPFIADIVNAAHPGKAKWQSIKESDHLFNRYPTMQDSMKNWPQGEFNPAIIGVMTSWVDEVLAKG